VDYILWVRGFRDPTISGRGFNLFKPLRRHFRATPFCRQVYNAGIVSVPNARRAFLDGAAIPACGKGSRKIEILSAFCGFSTLCKAENFPLYAARLRRRRGCGIAAEPADEPRGLTMAAASQARAPSRGARRRDLNAVFVSHAPSPRPAT